MKDLSHQISAKKLLIFDFDGTLANTSPLHEAAFRETLLNYNIDFSYDELAGLSTNKAFEYLLKKHDVSFTKDDLIILVKQKQQYVRKLINLELCPIDGLSKFLELASKKFRLCIVSSGSSLSINAALNKLGYTSYFDPIISIEDVKLSKPSSEGFKLALKTTSFAAEQAVIFEDSSAGFQAAKNAEIDYIDVNLINWHELYQKII